MNAWKLRDLRVIFKNHIPNMDHKHFQLAKRPFTVIFNSKPTNQVIRYELEGQVSAKIILEQKADFLKFDSNYSTLVVEKQYKNVNEINRLNALVNSKICLSFVLKHLYSIKDITSTAVTAYVIVDVLSLSRLFQQQP